MQGAERVEQGEAVAGSLEHGGSSGRPEPRSGTILGGVTDPAATEAALRESERRLRTVVSAVTAGIVFKGPKGEILECNPAAEEILGVTRDAAGRLAADPRIGALREDGSVYPFDEWPVFEALRTGRPVRNSMMGFQRDGRVRWARLNVVPLAEPGQRPYAAVVSLDDVTDERRAWVEVRRREQQLRVAMACAGHAYWEEDLETRRLVAGAPWLLLGYGEDEIERTAAAWVALGHPEDNPARLAARDAHVAGLTPSYRAEYRARARDGSWRWLLSSGRGLRDATGRITRMAGTVTDVTESKRLEGQLRHADRLASVGTLAAGVAHEVNNPLTYVMANLAFVDEALASLQRRGDGGGPAPDLAELRGAIGEALSGAARVKGIVQGLRQFATAPRGEERRRIDPRPEIEAALALARSEVAPRAALRVEVEERLPPIVAGEHELSQVLVNLLVNAGQAIPEGRAAEHEVVLSAEVDGGRLALTVRDTGAGIAPADVPRIFDPFFTTKPVGSGSGLGLSVCHGIVHSLGGAIEVSSTPGEGSTFRVLLPLAPEEPAAEAAARAQVPSPPASRVLVVDDEPLVARSVARLLGPAHQVTTVGSGAEALARTRDGARWDVILCDLMMPEMSGIDFEEALARERPDLVSRVVYLTGGAYTERGRAFLAAGRPFVEKPVSAEELRATVAAAAARAAPAD